MSEASAVKLDPIAEALDRLESGVGPHKILVRHEGGRFEMEDDVIGNPKDRHAVLVREDGFTLGCRRELYDAARELWPRQWVAVICYANTAHRVVVKLVR